MSVPVGEEIGVFAHYDDAKDMVNRLLSGGIPAQSVSIVGGDVTLVEHVTARYGYGRAAMAAALLQDELEEEEAAHEAHEGHQEVEER